MKKKQIKLTNLPKEKFKLFQRKKLKRKKKMEFDFYISKVLDSDDMNIVRLKGTDLHSVSLISQTDRHHRIYGGQAPKETKFHKIKKIVTKMGKASSKVKMKK